MIEDAMTAQERLAQFAPKQGRLRCWLRYKLRKYKKMRAAHAVKKQQIHNMYKVELKNTPLLGAKKCLHWDAVRATGDLKMLILSRYPGQSIWIGDDIEIVVLGSTRGATRIGIKAPLKINIVREELRDGGTHNEDNIDITKTYSA